MLKTLTTSFFYLLLLISLGCNEGVKSKRIVYAAISDSSYNPDSMYKQNLIQWKKVYEECMNYKLFQNAFYMGLQEQVNVGSINNKSAINVNGNTRILDTAYSEKLFKLLALISTSNCYSEINSNKDLQSKFLSELKNVLNQLNQYKYLNDLIDTTRITFRVTTFADNSIVPDSLVNLLQTTKDTALLHFKEILLTPGNALLVHDALIFGFDCEFPVRKKLSPADEEKFKNEAFFNFGNRHESGSIKLLSNQHLKITINKYYTVFGEFYAFKEVDN